MTIRTPLLLLGILVFPRGIHAASPADMEREYQQVRKIALRDPRVQAAYQEADRKLEAKILQIDPALEPYLKGKHSARESAPAPKPATKPFATVKTVPAKPAPKPAPTKTLPAPKGATHTVATGETLGGIAAKYRVTVAALKSANHIQDERKLRVGQVLAIPSGKAAPQSKKEESAWSRLMH